MTTTNGIDVLADSKYNKLQAAKALGVGRNTVTMLERVGLLKGRQYKQKRRWNTYYTGADIMRCDKIRNA